MYCNLHSTSTSPSSHTSLSYTVSKSNDCDLLFTVRPSDTFTFNCLPFGLQILPSMLCLRIAKSNSKRSFVHHTSKHFSMEANGNRGGAEGTSRGRRRGHAPGRGGPVSREVMMSKKLSWLLRHGAEKEGLQLGKGGYLNLRDVVSRFDYFRFLHVAVQRACRSMRRHRGRCGKGSNAAPD